VHGLLIREDRVVDTELLNSSHNIVQRDVLSQVVVDLSPNLLHEGVSLDLVLDNEQELHYIVDAFGVVVRQAEPFRCFFSVSHFLGEGPHYVILADDDLGFQSLEVLLDILTHDHFLDLHDDHHLLLLVLVEA